jgi:hypothetical protein
MEIYSESQVHDDAPLFAIVMFKAHVNDRRRLRTEVKPVDTNNNLGLDILLDAKFRTQFSLANVSSLKLLEVQTLV